jgi:hypothetical protein
VPSVLGACVGWFAARCVLIISFHFIDIE